MTMRARLAAPLLAVGCLAALAGETQASFHLAKIREIRAAGAATPFVEIQMYESGQNLLSGHTVTTYANGGAVIDTVPLSAVASGESQRTYLIAPAAVDGVAPDLTHSLGFASPGGAVCFENIDCVSYGSFSGAGLPSPAGSPFAAYPDPDGSLTLTRKLDRGCATLLEEQDDTNSSAADFAVTAPAPRNNSTPPTEVACGGGGGNDDNPPETTIDKGPQEQSAKTAAKFKFSSSEQGSDFQCKLDSKPFKDCASPQKYKHLDPGKHKFQVFATDRAGNADKTPAKYKFKVLA